MFAAIFIGISATCISQGRIALSTPKLEDRGDKLLITYDFINSKPGGVYLVDLIITDDLGNTVYTSSLSGDLGQNIKGGHNKIITWEYLADGVTDEINITVKIVIEEQKSRTTDPSSVSSSSTKTYTRTGLIFQSLALPGLGMTKLKEKPYWIYGIGGYGLLGTSLYFLNKSNASLDLYNEAEIEQDRDEYYEQYLSEHSICIISACGAAAIWLTDLILVSVSSKNINQYADRKIQIAPVYNYRTRSPMLSMTYKF